MYKVSVIIPFYNNLNWLYDAIDSVLVQTYNKYEIIVINDGSKEDCREFLKLYGDKIRYIYQENMGAAAARNAGINLATGDFIAFLDSDDIWLPDKLERQLKFMKDHDLAWSHTGFYYWYPKSGKLNQVFNTYDYDNVFEKTFISVRIATPSVMVRRSVLDNDTNLRFKVGYRVGEDTLFYRALSKQHPLGLLTSPLIKVRIREDNSNRQALLRFKFKYDEYLNLKEKDDFPNYIKRILSIYYYSFKIMTSNKFLNNEFIARCFWVLPFTIERVLLIFKFNSHVKKNTDFTKG